MLKFFCFRLSANTELSCFATSAMAGQQAPQRTSLDMADDVDDIDHIASVIAKLSARLNVKKEMVS